MATMQDIIERAYRKAGILGSGEELDADLAAEGLEEANAMLAEWKLRGVDISYMTKVLTNTFPLGIEYEQGVVLMLAERVSSDFNMPKGFNADDYFRAMQAAHMTISEVTLPKAVTELPTKKERDGTLGYLWR